MKKCINCGGNIEDRDFFDYLPYNEKNIEKYGGKKVTWKNGLNRLRISPLCEFCYKDRVIRPWLYAINKGVKETKKHKPTPFNFASLFSAITKEEFVITNEEQFIVSYYGREK